MTAFAVKFAALLTALTTLVSGSGSMDSLDALLTPDAPQSTLTIETATPLDICSEITIGWNLGNSLDATGSGINSETSWGNPVVTKELILAVKDAGFNAVRVPTTWFNHCDSDYNIDTAWFARVKEVVNYAYDEGMYVILNAHHENWNFTSADNYKAASKALKKIWKQVATEFESYDYRLIFEGMNEPRKNGTAVEWNGGDADGRDTVNKLNADFVKTVRATGGSNSYRCLMMPTYAASFAGISDLVLPDDDRLIIDIHAYTPYNFAMNTGNWSTDNFSKDDYNSTHELDTMSEYLYKNYMQKGVGVIIGECGAVNKGKPQQRLNWAEYFPAVFGQYGIPVFVWDNNAFGIGNEKLGLINRSTLKWEYPDYIAALVKSAEKY